jgi:hypothetical protein
MDRQQNRISVGGGVGGSVVAGNHNVVGNVVGAAPTAEPEPPDGNTEAMAPRLGFVVDVVGFGRRDAEEKADLQQRLDKLVSQVVADLGADRAGTLSSDAGDSRLMFLPVGVDSARVLPAMISAMTERLSRDNRRYRDRMRLRMSVGTGLVGTGPLGFTGELVVDLHRLVDCAVLREAVRDHQDVDLAMLVSQALYDDVIRPGHLASSGFTRVAVTVKEFNAPAWLRLYP